MLGGWGGGGKGKREGRGEKGRERERESHGGLPKMESLVKGVCLIVQSNSVDS